MPIISLLSVTEVVMYHPGQGTTEYANGDQYTGSYRNGCKHGYGVQDYFDGAKYDGAWVNNKPHGLVISLLSIKHYIMQSNVFCFYSEKGHIRTATVSNLCFQF